jgi:drug/metabolite transporter (DMT)-like permease
VAASALIGEPFELPDRAATWGAIVYLVVVGSVVVFSLYIVVLRYWTVSRMSYTFVVVPVVTVLLSAWLDDEPVRTSLLLGGSLVIAGVYVGALRPGRA